MDRQVSRRRLLRTSSALAISSMLAAPWAALRAAGAPPLRSLQLFVPTPPASQPDVIARWLIQPLERQAGVPGQVINRPGAAGALAADAVLAATPESGALLLGGLDHVAYSHLNSQRRALDPFVDFMPVGSVNRDSWVVVTSADGPVASLAGLVDRSRQGAGLNYPSTGEGSTAHLLSARLVKALDIHAQHVPYRDPWMPDLIAGRVQFAVAPVPAVVGQIRAGRLRALATLTDDRMPAFASVPSIRELGQPELVFHGGLFLFAPAALTPLVPQLNAWLVEVLKQPDIVQLYRDASIEPTPLNLAQTADAVRQRLLLVDGMRLAVFGRTR
jgi:tripartite-type tricarboxylate transporter receptor subunit TctC